MDRGVRGTRVRVGASAGGIQAARAGFFGRYQWALSAPINSARNCSLLKFKAPNAPFRTQIAHFKMPIAAKTAHFWHICLPPEANYPANPREEFRKIACILVTAVLSSLCECAEPTHKSETSRRRPTVPKWEANRHHPISNRRSAD